MEIGMLENKKILSIFAHPDDEIIVGWPILQNKLIDKYLIVCSDNRCRYNERAVNALSSMCKKENINLVECIDRPPSFYKIGVKYAKPTLNDIINRIQDVIHKTIKEIQPDYLFTHNPFGEYGHGDHRLVSDIIINCFQRIPIIITDIRIKSDVWFSYDVLPRMWNRLYCSTNLICKVKCKKNFYIQGKKTYKMFGAWSANSDIDLKQVFVTNLYKIKPK